MQPSVDPSSPSPPPLIETVALTKHFGSVTANDGIDIAVRAGEIHALLGENGAGKSTLVKMLFGVLQPTSGEIRWEGEPVILDSPAGAQALGIGMVFQHFSLFEALTVAENVAFALPDTMPLRQIAAEVREISESYGLPLDPHAPMHRLSVGERQRVEIVRCLMRQPKLIILDEPTSVLTPQETEGLFETLERLKREGRAVLYISHRLSEVKRLCDTATVLRQGRKVATCDPRQETPGSLARMMIGSEVREVKPAPAHELGPVRLSVDRLSWRKPEVQSVALRDVSLEVRGGEILGVAGVAGNGQEELFQALAGFFTSAPDAIRIDGRDVGKLDVNTRRRLGAAFVPEQRMGEAAVGELHLSENTFLSLHASEDLAPRGWLAMSRARAITRRVIERFDVRAGSADPLASTLSGGNLQKYVVGRELSRSPGVLVVNQPTWGVDAGAATMIRQALIDLAAAGSAVVVISQDLDEIYEVSDRIAAISHGRLSAARPVRELTVETLGLMMAGAESGEAAHAP
ncbi:ABC transporter ATP-binding protein [Lutibaculum baratangense]|uniref:Sugar ABC transporter, ATP-binding protein n=1 Tax=Lutibaculum baratangense AMV1 TaxID=631454 RepID=V4RU22_9HYPH|nr:ABC transporter ATP-binding protein [Lutibaculum baratangense]ESR26595.1 Sugar ABC transporter, ATP-binding protein [Lutibaculum baratangense AMV1]